MHHRDICLPAPEWLLASASSNIRSVAIERGDLAPYRVDRFNKRMNKTARAKQLKLSWEEIGYLTEGFSFASRPMKLASEGITAEYSLGPRGAWIMILIKNGQVYPLDLANMFRIGRSLITAELIPLTNARLITYRKSAGDKRRVELALTPLGEKAVVRVREDITKLVLQRLSGYTREEVLLCARLMHDFISSVGTPPARH